MPELPEEKRERFTREFKLSPYDADFLSADRELADYFEACAKDCANSRKASHWIMGTLLGYLNAAGKGISDSPVEPEALARLVNLIEEDVISEKIAKTVFEEMAASGKPAEQIVKEKGLVQVSDTAAIDAIVERVLAACETEVEAYRNGKKKLLGFFVGQVMKETKGKANPKIVNELLRKKLS